MRKLTKWMVFALPALVLVLVLAALLRVSVKAPVLPPPIALPTGETLFLRGVTYGTNHFAPGTPRWLRLLPGRVGKWAAVRFGPRNRLFFDRTTTEPSLLLWIEAIKTPSTNGMASTQTWAMLADEQGRVAGRREWLTMYSMSSNFGNIVEFRAFPRRAAQVQALLVQGTYDKPAVIGQWKIQNPVSASARPWTAQPFPASQSDGNLECSIPDLATSVGNSSGMIGTQRGPRVQYAPAKPGEEIEAAMPIKFSDHGVQTNTWEIGDLTLADASGNFVEAGSKSWQMLDNTLSLKWSPALWPSEPWELRLSAKRNADACYLPGELVEFKDVPLGGLDSAGPLQEEKHLDGVAILLSGFTRRKPLDTNHGWSSSDASELQAAIHGLTNGLYADLIRVVDDAGNAHKVVGSGGSSSPQTGGRDWHYNFSDIPLEARSLTFTFAVQHARHFTFRVQPTVVTNNITLPSR